jgi:hypothetical protein
MIQLRTLARLVSFSLAFTALGAADSQASLVSYNSRSAYEAATTGNTTITFDSYAPNPNGEFMPGNSFTVGNVTFTQPGAQLFVLNNSTFYYTEGLSSPYLNNNARARAESV